MRTVLTINANSRGSIGKNRDAMDYRKELQEVIELTEKAKRKLADLKLFQSMVHKMDIPKVY